MNLTSTLPVLSTTSAFTLKRTAAEVSSALLGVSGFTAGLAAGDLIRVNGTYEAAS
jgi:hypothetical protein